MRHYFDVINYAARSGDTRELAVLTADSCKSCKSIAQTIADVYAKGGHVEGENWQLRDATVLQLGPTKAVLSVGSYLAPDVVITSDGKKTGHAGGKQPMTVFMNLTGKTPVITRLDLVA